MLLTQYCPGDQIENEMVGIFSIYGERSSTYKVLVGGKGPLGRSRRRWEDNIKMDLQEVGCGRINLVINLRVL